MKLLFIFLISISTFAANLYCNHPRICEFLDKSLREQKLDFKIISSDDEKLLTTVDFFVAPPHYLSPKTSDIVKKREDKSLRTFRIYLPSHITKSYKLSSSNPVDELAYFWFYPDINCFIKNAFYDFLAELKYSLSKKDCSAEKKKIQNFKMNLAQIRPLNVKSEIFALKPLFNMKGITFNNNIEVDFYIGSNESNLMYYINTKEVNEFELFDLIYNKVESWVQEKAKK